MNTKGTFVAVALVALLVVGAFAADKAYKVVAHSQQVQAERIERALSGQ